MQLDKFQWVSNIVNYKKVVMTWLDLRDVYCLQHINFSSMQISPKKKEKKKDFLLLFKAKYISINISKKLAAS